jgi:hypothetical protein
LTISVVDESDIEVPPPTPFPTATPAPDEEESEEPEPVDTPEAPASSDDGFTFPQITFPSTAPITDAIIAIGEQLTDAGSAVVNTLATTFISVVQTIASDITSTTITYFAQTFRSITFLAESIGNGSRSIGDTLASIFTRSGQGWRILASGISKRYQDMVESTPQLAQNILVPLGKIASGVVQVTGKGVQLVGSGIQYTGKSLQDAGSRTVASVNNTFLIIQDGGTTAIFIVGEKTQDVSNTVGLAIIQFTYNFVSEPTKIYDVKVVALSPTSAKISWETNHPASGKVNYGLDETYPLDIQDGKKVYHHEFILTNLTPNTEYSFEVMSQNKNYVYDANRKFTTPGE